MQVKFKKLHPDAVLPAYAKVGDNGLDLTAISVTADEYGNIVYGTGLALEIPEGHTGLIFPRSSVCKKNLLLSNSVGVTDQNFRGELLVKFRPTSGSEEGGNAYSVGDRIAQLVIVPLPSIEPVWAENLSTTVRGTGGFGSSGN